MVQTMPIKKKETASDYSALSREIRLRFIEQKKVLCGPGYKIGTRMDTANIWKKAAQLCEGLAMNASDFVRHVFKLCPDRQGPVPTWICTTLAATILTAWAHPGKGSEFKSEDLDYLLMDQFNCLCRSALSIDPLNPRTIKALADHTEPFTAWFRVILAHFNSEIWYNFGHEAVKFLEINPAACNFLRERHYKVDEILSKFKTNPPNEFPLRNQTYE